MLGRERVAAIPLGKLGSFVEGDAKRSGMRLNQDVGNGNLARQFRMRAGMARVLMIAEVVPRPAVKTVVFNMRDVIGGNVVAQFITLVHASPENYGQGFDGQADGVANAPGIDAECRTIWIVLQDIGPVELGCV